MRIRPLVFSFSLIDLAISFLFFHVVFKISNFNKQTAKYLAQASCSEFYFNLKNVWNFDQNSRMRFYLPATCVYATNEHVIVLQRPLSM